MKLIDSHTHLYSEEFLTEPLPRHVKKGMELPPPVATPDGPAEAVGRAIEAGVEKMLLPANAPQEIAAMKALAARFPDNVSIAMGVHPTELGPDPEATLKAIEREVRENPGLYVAIGEIGLDFYWKPYDAKAQMEAFDRQCRLALELNLPIIIHCREALDAVLEVLDGLPAMPAGVFHSFGGSAEDVAKIRRRGDFYFGINGIVTFKNSTLPSVLPAIGIEQILLETDSPYLAPTPHRGTRNESAYLPAIAQSVAQALSLSPEKVAEVTSHNALNLFPGLK